MKIRPSTQLLQDGAATGDLLTWNGTEWVPGSPTGSGGDTSWTAATLVNSWANVGSGYAPAGFRKDDSGYVHLRGLLSGGSANSVMFTLPTGYRPAYKTPAIGTSELAPAHYEIGTTGTVLFVSCSSGSPSIDGIVFLAE